MEHNGVTELNAGRRTIFERLLALAGRFGTAGPPGTGGDEEPPLRSELFSADQMERHGKSLAAAHQVATGRAPDRLLDRLAENEAILIEVCDLLTVAVTANRRIAPAAEWLLDNFYLIEEQIRTAKRHLPRGYSRELPRLAHGTSAHLPRVYDIAFEAIAHGDGRVDAESLSRFVAAYQTVAPLKLGELWAIPIMLRLALIENLRRVGVRIAAGTVDRNRADAWADQMLEVAEHDPNNLILVIADMARSNPPMVSSFVAELARRLQGQSAALALPLTWIEHRLFESGFSIEQLVHAEAQEQAGVQVSISNTIGSLRFLGAMDWRDFVETMSIVEQKLREDPGGLYGTMDFATRDRYRHVVEAIAKRSPLSECDVARKAIQLAYEGDAGPAGRNGDDDRAAHVGFYLIDKGRRRLERAASMHVSVAAALARAARRIPLVLYLGAIGAITLALTWWLLALARAGGVALEGLVPLGVLLLLAASQLAVAMVNWLSTVLVSPHPLPRMDYGDGLPSHLRTLVVVPTLLTDAAAIEDLVEALEVRFLANRDRCLHFGLLTDFQDARTETVPEDAALLEVARAGIANLNAKYADDDGEGATSPFFLFHRPRRWNPQERVWMGHERKRGKLSDLNALLRGRGADLFSVIVGATAGLSSVRYVITLDTDTQLPRDSARQFVGVMAHPLNRARFTGRGKARDLVTEGYGILQPRVEHQRSRRQSLVVRPAARRRTRHRSVHPHRVRRLPGRVRRRFLHRQGHLRRRRVRAGACREVSREPDPEPRSPRGLLRAFGVVERRRAVRRVSRDLWRRHEPPPSLGSRRLGAGGMAVVAGAGSRAAPGAQSAVGPLAMEALRQPPAQRGPGGADAAAAGGMDDASACVAVDAGRGRGRAPAYRERAPAGTRAQARRRAAAAACRGCRGGALRGAAQTVLTLAFLPYEATVNLDAIARTTWRMLVTRRGLLEWNPAAADDSERRRLDGTSGRSEFLASVKAMWIAPFIALAAAVMLAAAAPLALTVAAPILLLWFASPGIAWWISRPLARREVHLTPPQALFLRKLARRTWGFFEAFVGPDDHWLPPDNMQEQPVAAVAHRTSPTNIGFSLLASLTAYDFGYVSGRRAPPAHGEHVRHAAFDAAPRGALLQLVRHAVAAAAAPSLHLRGGQRQSRGALADVAAGIARAGRRTRRRGALVRGLERCVADRRGVRGRLRPRVVHPPAARTGDGVRFAPRDARRDAALARSTGAERRRRRGRCGGHAGGARRRWLRRCVRDASFWAEALLRQWRALRDEVAFLAPWLALPMAPAGLRDFAGIGEVPTLRGLAALDEVRLPAIETRLRLELPAADRAWLAALHAAITLASARATERIAQIERLAATCEALAQMAYGFLYDDARHLLAIGYNVGEHRRDAGYYDLLASEARFTSFVAIAQGQLPQENWFALGRLLTTAGGQSVLMSWSGSMFEYLMPMLVMPTYDNTLLDQTCRASVARQIAYGKQRGLPWGISECGYNGVDAGLNYQYRAFGVPGLGLKRGLAEDLVIAPYASALALMVTPEAACANLQRLAGEGLAGRFGMYEAVDYTPARVPRGQTSAVVRSFMAHHQGMILLSLAHLLLARPMQRRFESDPQFKATLLLLHERVPKSAVLFAHPAELAAIRGAAESPETPVRVLRSPDTPVPEVQLLSNGRYHVMVTNAGGGSSRWKDLAVTRWREDTTCDHWGTFCYIRDVASGEFWSTAHQPTRRARRTTRRSSPRRAPSFAAPTTTSSRTPRSSSRRRTTSNCGGCASPTAARTTRTIDVTSYAEVALAPPAADALHPAFSNLFVQTEIIRPRQAILCTRRPRSVDERPPWMFHLMAVHGADSLDVSYETDRMAFIGRGRTVAAPRGDDRGRRPGGRTGLGAGSGRGDPAPGHARAAADRDDRHRVRAWPTRAMARSPSSASTRTATWRTACSTSRGRTAS